MEAYDVIVLGAGGVGSAALYHLAHRGARVLGIDRYHPPHDRGSTHGTTRVIRQAYFEHPDYVPLVVEGYRLWHDLEQQVGRRLFHETGLVEIGRADGVVVPGVLRAAEEHRLEVEQLFAAEIEHRWPGLRVPDEMVGVYEPGAGYLLVEECVRAHLEAAAAAGARLRTDTEVHGWSATGDAARVRTSAGEFAAAALVIAAGPWAGSMLSSIWEGEAPAEPSAGSQFASAGASPSPLTVLRKSLFWFECDAPQYDAAAGFPVFLFELPAGMFYGFPKLDGRGVKVAEHTGGRPIDDPANVNREIDPGEERVLRDFLAAHLPGVSPRVADHAVCLYTMSPDEHFIVDRHPAHANVVFAAGLSGHGFKFTPVLGLALANLAHVGTTDLPIGFLSLERFN
jgi:monomeric sarcosine oxidase